jgi:hypothetical protein
MKFQQLPIGARFELDGQVYVKTGPIAAAGESGAPRMIPRHAVLRPLDGMPPAPPPPSRKLDEHRVLAAFAAFCTDCEALLGEQGRPALDAARQRFLAALR